MSEENTGSTYLTAAKGWNKNYWLIEATSHVSEHQTHRDIKSKITRTEKVFSLTLKILSKSLDETRSKGRALHQLVARCERVPDCTGHRWYNTGWRKVGGGLQAHQKHEASNPGLAYTGKTA